MITYVGCFDSQGSERYYNGYGQVDFCASDHPDALTGASYYFGLEYPQGRSIPGEGDCMRMPSDRSTWGGAATAWSSAVVGYPSDYLTYRILPEEEKDDLDACKAHCAADPDCKQILYGGVSSGETCIKLNSASTAVPNGDGNWATYTVLYPFAEPKDDADCEGEI